MITSSGKIQSIANLYMNNIENAPHKTGTPQKKSQMNDEIILSDASQEFSGYLNKLREMPEVREDVVEDARNSINDNSYHVDADDIAQKILEGTIL